MTLCTYLSLNSIDLLQLILNFPIKNISFPEREKVIEARSDCKGIRLNVYVQDKITNRSFDVEIELYVAVQIVKSNRKAMQEFMIFEMLKAVWKANNVGFCADELKEMKLAQNAP